MSPRTLTAAVETASLAAVVRGPVAFVKIAFDTGTLRFNASDRNYNISVDGDGSQQYLGVGRIGGISQVAETSELQATGLTMTLRGIPSENVALALAEDFQGRICRVWAVYLDVDFQVILDPLLAYEGFIDKMDIALGETAQVSVQVEHEFTRWESANIRRYTNEDQQLLFPGDRGLEFMPNAEKEFFWGFKGAI